MPEYDEDGNEIEDPEQGEGMKGLRQAKKAAEARQAELETQLAQANAERRELAAMKAGLDPTDKATAFFLKHFDGEPTADVMKAAAIEAGVLPEIDPQAAASVQGQQQMATAFTAGEHTPLGTTTIGPPSNRIAVPAEEAEMWQAFEARVKQGDMQGGLEVLRASGRQVTGIEDYEYDPGAGAAQITPISGRPM